MDTMTAWSRRPGAAIASGLAGVAAVTAALRAAEDTVNVATAPVVYQLLVLLVSGAFGVVPGLVTGAASVVAFNWFFVPPFHTLHISESRNWVALAVFAVTAVITSRLAGGSYRFREETRARRRDSDSLARLSRAILASIGPETPGPPVTTAAADALEVESCEVVRRAGDAPAARPGRPAASGFTVPLVAAGGVVGELRVGPARPGTERWRNDDLAAAVATLLAVALERSRLIAVALETEALRRSDTLKTAVIQGVSHDFRTPLTAIRAAVEALHGPLADGDDRELLAVIEAQTARLDRLVGNLLDLSRLEGGAIAPRLDVCDPEDLVGTALAATLGVVDPHDVTVDLGDDAPLVTADAVLTERVLVNLLQNAVMHGRPPILVEVRGRPGWVEIAVQDAGPGLGGEPAERTFHPFLRNGSRGALGIGLAVARGLAEVQGGELAHRPTPGGARFVLSLPVAPAPAPVVT